MVRRAISTIEKEIANNRFLDITTCKIKYEEGFANMLGHIYTKPEPMWTKADQALVIPTGKMAY